MMFAVALILLHSPDGFMVEVNPDQVTSLRSQREGGGERFAKDARCMISLTDGKFVVVIESCEAVRKLITERR